MTSLDISCANYNKNYNNAINQIAQTSAANRTWTRVEGFNNNPLIANTFCGGISSDIQQRFLNKKKYIFSNNQNNVQSGNGNKLLTKAQIYSRVARGYTPEGKVAPGYGKQTSTITDPNPFNLSRVYNRLITSCCTPVGGDISKINNYTLHTFTNDGVFIVSGYGCPSLACEIVLVGGGAGGSNAAWPAQGGGGGGGGEVIKIDNYTLMPGSYNITIGKGGSPNNNGTDTVMSLVGTAKSGKAPTLMGVNGQGYGWQGGVSGSGNAGGARIERNANGNPPFNYYASMGGGGGGSDGVGVDASYQYTLITSIWETSVKFINPIGGNGGKGTELDWTGETLYLGYGGGGGGGNIYTNYWDQADISGNPPPNPGFGGWYENNSSISAGTSGNGGKGMQPGFDALYSYGGGGGGGSRSSLGYPNQNGGSGGNGVVFIRYLYNTYN